MIGSSALSSRPISRRVGGARANAFLNLKLPSFGASAKSESRMEKKQELLDYLAPLKRGLLATPEQRAEVEARAAALERANPTPKPLASPLLNGRWRLEYTTSDSILGTSKPAFLRPSGPIYQFLDGGSLKAKNQETGPLYNSVDAELTPLSSSKVKVQFKTFRIFGLIPITAPPTAVGELDVTYLDETLRISRGDKGNLFVLVQDGPDARLP
ncbi:MAG: hypothetical protein J3K34DRAFT_398508 [Monoraphidium minutum]|nr:MAG: hypothetical protein J3K34DRAFT_398508 [Monoraphidium minutum]